MIHGAAAGRSEDRTEFAERYQPAVRAYLLARWRSTPLRQETDDATQEVFVECFRGALGRARPERGAFRPYLYGIVRNVALRWEERRRRQREEQASDVIEMRSDEDSLSDAFDRAWALSIMRQAGRRMEQQALASGPEAERRVVLLKLRFEEEMPIREIARAWQLDPAWLHHEYAKARREFRAALHAVVAFHGSDEQAVERECAHLLSFFR